MGTAGTLIARIRRIDLVWVDRFAAVALMAGAIPDAFSEPHKQVGVVAIAGLVVLMGSVAWRRIDSVLTTALAVSGLIVFEIASHYNGDGSFEVAALALNFYTLGRRPWRRARIVLLAYGMVGAAVVTYVPTHGTVGGMLGGWALAGLLPYLAGRTLARRSALAAELRAASARLRDEQELRARRAAAEERNRMARELHDVIAHCVSVMVVQTGAARRVAAADVQSAREALRVVESSGREALVELRRIVGVLRRGRDELPDLAAPGLAQLDALAERSRGAGLPVDLTVEGELAALSPELDLVAYRVVQEALTNAIKHAGPARASVSVAVGKRGLELVVSDNGRASAPEQASVNGSGHGLVGMAERVKQYGGELQAGARQDGGFEVSARMPLSRPVNSVAPASAEEAETEPEARIRWPWLDPVLVGVVLVVLETAVLAVDHRRGPLVLNVLAVAGIALATVWRRRSPFVFLLVVGLLGSVMNAWLIEFDKSPLIGIYFVLVPPYTVAAWGTRSEALAGLVVFISGAAGSQLISQRGKLGDFVGAAFTVSAAWAVGRAIRSHRLLTAELRRTNAQLAAEREDRARLAVAGERSRIARELHTAVARSVAAMVVQAEGCLRLLGEDPKQADAAMDEIETTGRAVLAEMRRVLGVLRHGEALRELTPQPGVDQIYALIQQARHEGRAVELRVDGDAGTLAAGIELGLYRILENALGSAGGGPVRVALMFGQDELELRLEADCDGPNGWPTDVMRERLVLCGGRVEPAAGDEAGWRFGAWMPRGLFEGAAA
ncbi:MAG: sensor histidine kinase [Solirubrobacteraceae bacterium]